MLFPSTSFRRPSRLRKRKAVKSAAFIEDSDSDLAEDDPLLDDDQQDESEDDMLV